MATGTSSMASGTSSLYTGSDDCDLACDVCQYQGINSQATSYCNVCTEALCLVCEKVHKASKQTRSHILLTGGQLFSIPSRRQATPSTMNCDKHQMVLEYFCKDDNVVFCKTCKKTSHELCDTIDVSKYIAQNDPAKTFDIIREKIVFLESYYEQSLKERKGKKDILKEEIQNCLTDMKMIRKDLDRLLYDLEQKIIAEMSELQDEISNEIDDQIIVADETLRKIRGTITSMDECQTTGQKDAMFVGMKKAEEGIPEYEKLIRVMEKELGDIDIQFIPDDFFTVHLNELKSLGRLERQNKDLKDLDCSCLGVTVSDLIHHDVGCTVVQSVVFLPDGHIVLACNEEGLKLLNKDFIEISQLPMRAVSACKTSDTEVLVSEGIDKRLRLVEVLPAKGAMTAKYILRIGTICGGVDFYNNEIYVVAWKGLQRRREVRVLNNIGNLIRRLGDFGLQRSYTESCAIKVNSRGDAIFVCGVEWDTVICYNQDGRMIYKYTDRNMTYPFGMYVDGNDNLFLCGFRSNNIQVITADGKKHSTLLTEKDGIQQPLCISYRQHDGCFVVGMRCDNKYSLATFKSRLK